VTFRHMYKIYTLMEITSTNITKFYNYYIIKPNARRVSLLNTPFCNREVALYSGP
jgi:hypothetical protein